MSQNETRKQMIDTAIRMFQEHGYHGVSWRKLVKEAGTPWGSIAHHFPGGKIELAVAAIDAGAKTVTDLLSYCFGKEPDAPSAISKWFYISASHIDKSGYQIGCPVSSIALSTVPQVPEISVASLKAFKSWEEAITAFLRSEQNIKRPSEIAKTIVTLLEGGIVCARIEQSKKPLISAGNEAAKIVTAALQNIRK